MTVDDLSIVASTLIEAWVAAPLFGANAVLYFLCTGVLLKRNPHTSTAARWLLIIVTLQLAIAAGHISTLLAKIVHAFVTLEGVPGGTEEFLADFTTPLHTAEQALYTLNDIIASGVLTWRCYVVWEHSWLPCVPMIIAWVSTAVAGIGSIAVLASTSKGFSTFFAPPLRAWLVTFWVSSVVTQLGATALIAYRIWAAIAWRARATRSTEWAILRIFVESGALYSAGTTVVLVLYLLNTAAGTIVAGMLGQLSTTTPYLMIVRAEARRSRRDANYVAPRLESTDAERAIHSKRRAGRVFEGRESIPMENLKQSSSNGSVREVTLPPGW